MDILISVLLVVIGLSLGIAVVVISNNMKENNANKKAEMIIEKSKKEADKAKRDALFEAKEEAHKLKLEVDK